MKLFSKLVESANSIRNYKVQAEIELVISAANQGESSYLADSILAATKNQSEYTIKSIEEVSEMSESVDIDMNNITQDLLPEDKILTAWNNAFGNRLPTSDEKMEFYHQLRELGFDGVIIFDVLKGKI